MNATERFPAMKRRRRRAAILVAGGASWLLVAVACTTTLTGGLNLVTGPDNGFAQNPQPTTLKIALVNSNGDATTVAQGPIGGDASLSIPPQSGANVDIIQVTGYDDAGDAVVFGSTIPIALDQLSGLTLNVFVQRTGQFSRLPSADGGTGLFQWVDGGAISRAPLMTTLYSRYLLVADGTGKSTNTQLYDTLTWQVDPQPPPLPIAPLSLVYIDTWTGTDASVDGGATSIAALLALGKNGAASWLDLTDSTGTSVDAEVYSEAGNLPAPGEFTAVAGGQTLVTNGSNGNTYVVGGTRLTGGATNGVLRVSPTGVFSWTTLLYAREGATAVYANNGVFVFGGNAPKGDGGTAAGVEYFEDTAASATPIGYGVPTDTTTGAGGVALDTDTILIAGGVLPDGAPAPIREFSIAALNKLSSNPGSLDAGVMEWMQLPVSLTSAQVYGISPTTAPQGASALVIGNVAVPPKVDGAIPASDAAAPGTTLAYIITRTSVTPVKFQVPRANGQSALLPNLSVAVVGGDSGTIESFVP